VALVENFDMYKKMLEEYSTASGSAMAENEVRMDSWETKVNQLRNAINSFWNNTIDTGFVKSMISGITVLINNFGNLRTILGIVFTMLAVNKGTAFLTFLKNFSLSTTLLNSSLVQTQARLAGVEFSQMKLMTTTQMLTFATKGLWAAMIANPIGLVVGAVTAVVMAFDFLGASAEKSAQKQKEEFDSLKQSISSLKQQTAEAKNLASEYESLSVKTSLTTEEESKLADVKDRLITQFPDLIQGYDSEGNAIIGSSKAIQQAIKDNEELLKAKQEQMAITFTTDGANNFSQLQEDQQQLDLLTQHKEKYLKIIDDINNGDQAQFDANGNDSLAIAKNNLKGIKDELTELSGKVLGSRKDLSDLADSFLQSSDSAKSLGKEAITTLIYGLSTLKDESKVTGEQFTKIFDGLESSNFASEIDRAKTALEGLVGSGASQDEIGVAYEKAISGLSPYLTKLGVDGEEVGKILKDMLNLPNAQEASSNINSVTTSLSTLQKTLSDSSSAISEIDSVLKDYNESHKFNLDSIIKLSEKYPQLLSILGDEKAIRQELTNIISEQQNTAKEAYTQMLMSSTDFYNKNLEGVESLVKALGIQREVDLSGAKDLASAKLQVELALIQKLASLWADYYDAQGNLFTNTMVNGQKAGIDNTLVGSFIADEQGDLHKITSAMDKQMGAYLAASNKAKAGFDKIALSGTSGVDFSRIGMGSAKTSGAKKDSSKNDPSYKDTTDALIAQINAESLLAKTKSESVKKELDQAKSNKDYQLQLEKTNSLIQSQIDHITSLKTANSKITQTIHNIRSSSFSADGWLTLDGELTLKYYEQFNSASKTTQEEMQKEADKLSKLQKAWYDNSQAIDSVIESQKEFQATILTINLDIFNSAIEKTNSQLELSKARISLLEESSSSYNSELNNQIALYRELISQQQAIIDFSNQQLLNDNLSIEAKQTLTKAIEDATISQINYQKTIQDTAKQLAMDVLEAQKELAQRELDAEEKVLNAYIERKEAKIKGIQEEIEALDKKNELEEEQEERQKRLLAIEEAKQRLNNVLNEKNTRVLVGNQWEWQSNPTDVKDAQDDLKSLKEDYVDWEDDINLKHRKASLQAEIDYQQKLIDEKEESFNKQKTIFEEQWKNIDAMSNQLLAKYGDNVDKAVEELSKKLVSLNSQLSALVDNETSLPSSLSNYGGSSSGGSSNSRKNNTGNSSLGSYISDYEDRVAEREYNEDGSAYTDYDKDGKTIGGGVAGTEDIDSNGGIVMIKKKKKYHQGGWVGDMHKNLEPDEIPAILQKGEFILSKLMIDKISNLPSLPNFKLPDLSNIKLPTLNNGVSGNGGNLITINTLNVTAKNANDLISQLKNLQRLNR